MKPRTQKILFNLMKTFYFRMKLLMSLVKMLVNHTQRLSTLKFGRIPYKTYRSPSNKLSSAPTPKAKSKEIQCNCYV